ncbi:hypothetical protein N7517_006339 [Penicillium concentricum]|uniref:Uncharacterized protein n=1 Tax=Penicillium concentricum TaxID=293559 RepID=A0A9W9V9X0_9EURO|nr:uncharacterized protein N7517_006339 [Penicillium concentricum]KAJ5374333.1 hypothetical protein N7517_006339 [Penicillium concentricum]
MLQSTCLRHENLRGIHEGASIFTAIRKKYHERQSTWDLEHSLSRGQTEIQSLYHQHYQELDQQYEEGDWIAREQMKDIIITLQGTLLRHLRLAEDHGATLDLVPLQIEVEEARVRTLVIMRDLYRRLLESVYVPRAFSMSTNLNGESLSDVDTGNATLLHGVDATLEQSLSPSGTESQDAIFHQSRPLFLAQSSDSSTAFSVATNITSLELEEDSIDAGIPTKNMDHLLNAACYFSVLDQLERQTAQTLGMKDSPYIELESLHGCIECLENYYAALGDLGSEGFCGTMISILIEDQDRNGVAKAFHVSLRQIRSLLQTMANEFDEEFLKRCTKRWMQKVLNVDVTALSDCNLVGIIRPLCEILSIGLVSFSGSHVSRFDINLWDQEMEKIPVSLDGYAFMPRKLACLDDFIGGPAWILGKASAPSGGMKISLTLQDLDELWGPVSLVGGTTDEAPVIQTERGFIVPLPREQQSSSFNSSLCGEIECHWVTEIPEYISDENADTAILIHDTSRILIGTCPDGDAGLVVNEKCKSSIYVSDGYDVQLVGGQYVTAGIMKKYKRIPKRTLKAMLITDCTKPDTRLVPLLNLRVGLEVSACTGNAQRVTLWDALRFSQTSTQPTDHPIYCAHKVGDKYCINSCWTRWQSIEEIDSLDYTPGRVQVLTGAEARRLIINAILALEHSGIDSDGNLQVSWPFSNSPASCPVLPSTPQESHNWFRVVKDTRDTSSFAVFSQRCLEFSEEETIRACSALSKEGHLRPFQTTLLTRILAPGQEGSVSGLLVGVRFLIGEAHLTVTKAVQDQLAIIATVSMNPLNPLRYRLREILPDARAIDFKEQIWPDITAGGSVPIFIH